MTELPDRNGPAAELARLMHERGLTARIRPFGTLLTVITVSNPAVPRGQLSQDVVFAPNKKGGRFAWLFERGPNQFYTEPIAPASSIAVVAERVARVVAVTGRPDAS
jgi:hypothetical protein